MSGNYPDKYLLFNQKLSKQLSLVLEIEGVGLFGVADTFTKVRYGDPGLVYGLPGLVYGGLRSLNTIKPYIMLDAGLNIQQRIEPEVGRGNIGQLVINLIDYSGDVSFALAPGNVVPEIMGQLCRLWLGYTQTSYPEDYVLVYQGQITQITCPPGMVSLQISDPTTKARQPLFAIGTTTLTQDMPATGSSATANLGNTGVLHAQILGPNGKYDPVVSTYIVIDSEIMQYAATGIISPTQVVVSRAVLGSQIATHTAGTTVNGSVSFGEVGGINCIDFALKLLLSGFGGPEFTGVGILSFVYDYNGHNVPNEFVLSTEDASLDLGLVPGDYFYITGSASGNNVSGQITGIAAGAQGRNNIVQTNQTFTIENPTSALVAFRSQYDTFPTTCGLGCFSNEVDVSTFQAIKKNYFTAGGGSDLVAYYDAAADGLDTIVNDIMLPIGCYSISRYGRISMAITKPPLPGSGTKLVQLDYTNVIDPDKIQVVRATNQRSFYNEISYEYDYDIINNSFNSIQYFLDTNSLHDFGYTVVLPVQAKTVSTALGGALIAQTRGNAILERFKNCLIWVELTVNWSVGSLLEVSDIVVLKDEGNLKIMNFETGERNLGTQLFEVIDRNYQIITGNVRLKLLGGLGFNLSNRYGLISPSSVLGSGSTASQVIVTPSYGQPDIPSEMLKWGPLVGQGVMVHDSKWSVTGSSFIQALSSTNPAGLMLSPPLAFAPSAGMILDIAPYPTTTTTTNVLEASLYAFITPSIPVLTGISDTKFTVAPASAALLNVGNWVTLRDTLYETQSPQDDVAGVTGGTVALVQALTSGGSTFVPTSAFFVEGCGFKDGTGAYLYG